MVKLARRQPFHGANFEEILQDILRTSACNLKVERVSLWFYSGDRQQIECVQLFRQSAQGFTAGMTLTASDYPHYFAALQKERTPRAKLQPSRQNNRANGRGSDCTVKDNGVGIRPHQRSHLFDLYYYRGSESHHCRGIGLGLYLCRQIIAPHRGQIGIEQSQVQGVTFPLASTT
ncbi:MAG: ATP-binding protein [Thermosynechococcus sp. Uc]|uniref:sensor histidine kinase n=1 Tax=Thermosynechococcus sp. Uc TaxID=3034853 RepID=UPI00259D5C18|nr:ATP-binding protein [Thermosynechococcus sp. Uc]MDM7325743.1 ATP-binding protein [Thermosynechococcus sp. Uc]